MREFYLEREQAWLKLARSYQFAERISRKLGQVNGRRFRDWPSSARVRNCPSCKIETTVSCDGLVICPNCRRIVDQVV